MKTAAQHNTKLSDLSSRALSPWLTYGAVFSLLWILLTKGELGSWIIGIVAVPLATWSAIRLFRPTDGRAEPENESHPTLRVGALLRFVPFFFIQSLRGGWESAVLAIRPGTLQNSIFIRYRSRLPKGRARVFFSNTVCLLPGTVSADWQGDMITIHALDNRANHHRALRECEQQIAALFGLHLGDVSVSDEAPAAGIGEPQ